MRARAARLLLALGLLAGCAAPVSEAPVLSAHRKTVICTRVIDGDTIEVSGDGQISRVRLLCINTPERGKPGCKEATEFLRRKVEGREISLERDPEHADVDRFGRKLRYVWLGGELVNAQIIRAGHSTYWTRFGKSSLHPELGDG